jgi:hypothetical protein
VVVKALLCSNMKATQSHSKDIAAVASELTTIVRETKPFLQAVKARSRRARATALTMMHPQSKPLQKPRRCSNKKSLIQGSISWNFRNRQKNLDVVVVLVDVVAVL